MTLLARRYAAALHALASETGVADAVADGLQQLHVAFADKTVRAVLTSPDVTATERAQFLGKLSRGQHAVLANLIGVLQHRRRLDVLFDLYPAYRELRMLARNEVDCTIESAHALSADEVAAVEALAAKLSGKNVQTTVAVRADLLGGVRLRMGNVLYDGSLRAALDQLEQKLAQSTV
ncbi:MAG: ATP synthase F1 subunit delta [Planctomycetota bacterium]